MRPTVLHKKKHLFRQAKRVAHEATAGAHKASNHTPVCPFRQKAVGQLHTRQAIIHRCAHFARKLLDRQHRSTFSADPLFRPCDGKPKKSTTEQSFVACINISSSNHRCQMFHDSSIRKQTIRRIVSSVSFSFLTHPMNLGFVLTTSSQPIILRSAQTLVQTSQEKIQQTATKSQRELETTRPRRRKLAKVSTVRHGGGAPGAGSTPSGCCSPTGCGRPPAACRRRSGAAGPGGCPPCPGSSASRRRSCPTAPRPG
ncbi:unnamed protein product [Ectocarpus sp. 8 AP-2014]